jgi:hypothetical protein
MRRRASSEDGDGAGEIRARPANDARCRRCGRCPAYRVVYAADAERGDEPSFRSSGGVRLREPGLPMWIILSRVSETRAGRELVASDEHLALLGQGTAIWNEWRLRSRDIQPNLSGADLRGANLSEGRLGGTDLSGSDLSGANLGATYLGGADLHEANLNGTNLNEAIFYKTIFLEVDLETTIGLDNCEHRGPSIIDFKTLSLSVNLPIAFLRGCGLPDTLIEYLPSLRGNAIQFYSCFISYSSKDQLFAERLHADLQNKGVRCWFAPHDLPIGAKTWDAIDDAIRLRDKLLVILSEASIASDWVEDEVNKAYAEERVAAKSGGLQGACPAGP